MLKSKGALMFFVVLVIAGLLTAYALSSSKKAEAPAPAPAVEAPSGPVEPAK